MQRSVLLHHQAPRGQRADLAPRVPHHHRRLVQLVQLVQGRLAAGADARAMLHHRVWRRHQVLDQIARQHNARPSQIALAWLLKRSPTMLPIPGTSSVHHLEENVRGATIQLTQEEFDTIERAAASR